MFEQFFTLPRTVAHHRASPLLEERLRYPRHLAGQGLARWTLATAARYLLRVAVALRLANRPGEVVDLAEIDQQANLWANRFPQRQQRRRSRAYYHLRLADFDWERELLHITRSKTGRPQTYPLRRTLGNAVLRYLREVRPRCTCRAVFLT